MNPPTKRNELTYEAEAEEVTTESIVTTLLGKVKVP
jgi:hypothetical protein